jgi:hypothetical protein
MNNNPKMKFHSLSRQFLLLIFVWISTYVHGQNNALGKAENTSDIAAGRPLSEAEFRSPSIQYKPQLWWHWLNGHISKEAIAKDLESFRKGGFGGFTLFNSSEGMPAPGPVDYMSDAWFDMLKHTGRESARLGLKMGICNGSGWSVSGGPWVEPEQAMQEVVWTEKQVTGPIRFDAFLETPLPALGIERDMQKNAEVNKRYYVPRERVAGHYHDIILLAFPTPKGEREGMPFRIRDWWGKSGFHKYAAYVKDQRTPENADMLDPAKIIDISKYLDSNGRLQWEVPPGEWTILRLGYQPTGRQNHPAAAGGRGLEINKLSASAVRYFWEHSAGRMVDSLEAAAPGTVKFVLIDSYEAGHQNWTSEFDREFETRRGYDPLLYLPALTGRVVKDMETSEKFLWDFRKTIGDLLAENFYGEMARMCHKKGLFLAAEPYGSFGNTNDFKVAGLVDLPMNEWWVASPEEFPTATAKLVSSAAHTYGRTVVGSEAFTGTPYRIFEESPRDFKMQGDYFFSAGINQFSLHAFVHDPYEIAPGFGLGGYGARFDRRNTWWPYINGWTDYLSRCQYLLQQGKPVTDFLYYAGEDAPLAPLLRTQLNPTPPTGFDYDFCNTEIFHALETVNGELRIPGGKAYQALILPDQPHMTSEVLRKVEELIRAGAVVVGQKPSRIPGLESPEKGKEFFSLVNRIWANCDGETVKTHRYGSGIVAWGILLKEIADWRKLFPDFSYRVIGENNSEKTLYSGNGIEFIHREAEGTDCYFVTNQHDTPKTIEATFRIDSRLPELWYPEDGRIEVAPAFRRSTDGNMNVTLSLKSAESVFVVFRSPLRNEIGIASVSGEVDASQIRFDRDNDRIFVQSGKATNVQVELSDGTSQNISISAPPKPVELTGPWNVLFSDREKSVFFPQLIDWMEHDDPNIRYYSGSALYSASFRINARQSTKGTKCILDLGEVEVIAEVILNGKSLGILWKSPYQTDITEHLLSGKNRLEIRVANLWINRLIGDSQYPDDSEWTNNKGTTVEGMALREIPRRVVEGLPESSSRTTFVGWKWPHLEGKSLMPSGLIGPVRLIFESEQALAVK